MSLPLVRRPALARARQDVPAPPRAPPSGGVLGVPSGALTSRPVEHRQRADQHRADAGGVVARGTLGDGRRDLLARGRRRGLGRRPDRPVTGTAASLQEGRICLQRHRIDFIHPRPPVPQGPGGASPRESFGTGSRSPCTGPRLRRRSGRRAFPAAPVCRSWSIANTAERTRSAQLSRTAHVSLSWFPNSRQCDGLETPALWQTALTDTPAGSPCQYAAIATSSTSSGFGVAQGPQFGGGDCHARRPR